MLLERQRFEFDDFLLDANEQILLRGGKPLSITPKAFQLLLVLVENHGHLVKKDELMNAVWADSFVEEANLAFTIGLLRKALEDDAQHPRFIETVPRRGYRFIGELRENEQKQSEIVPEQHPEEAVDLSKYSLAISDTVIAEKADEANSSGKNWTAAALALVVLLAGAITLGYYFFSQKNVAVSDKKTIAVLPLKPINTANRDEIYEIGIADSLIYKLSSMKGFVVRPLSATRKYADIEQDPIAAGREQQVDYVLASNYQLAGGKIKVTSQLFNVANGQIEETYKSEKEAGDVFAMQDAIAGEVGNILLTRFAVTSSGPTAKRGTTNEEAYRLYLQGMYLYDKRNLADARKAVEVLEQAVRFDPNYAQAWAGKAHAHRTIGNYGRIVNTHEEYQKSIEAVNKALALDENLSEAHSALCDDKMYYEYDFAGAERECKRAIELNPNSSLAHQIYSRYLNSRGRSDEAISEIKTAIDLEPTSFYNQRNLGVSLYFARRFKEAAAQFKRVIATDENNDSTYVWLSFTLPLQGNEAEDFKWFMKSPEMQNADKEIIHAFQTAFQTSGWQGVLRERAKRFEKSDEAYFQGAAYNAQISNKEKAFEYLEKSFERRELWMANLQVDPRLDSLRDDPRFDELVRRVGVK